MPGPHPSPHLLTTHRPPALLVESVVACTADGGRVRLLPGVWDGLQLLEAAAQAVAVIYGAQAHAQGGGGPESGSLVAVRDVQVGRAAGQGDSVEVEVRALHALGALQLVAVRAWAGDEELLSGELTVARGGTP